MEATGHQTARQTALERFERATELPLLILAWRRYAAAGIEVVDLLTGLKLDLEVAAQQ